MQNSPQAFSFGCTELHEMEMQQWEIPGNLSSSYTPVINFKVFMTKVCTCSLFSIKISSIKEHSCGILVRGEMKPMQTEQLQMLLQSPSPRSEDTWWAEPAGGVHRIPVPAAFLLFWQRQREKSSNWAAAGGLLLPVVPSQGYKQWFAEPSLYSLCLWRGIQVSCSASG